MALTATTLAGDLAINDTIVELTSSTGYPAVGTIVGNNSVRMEIDGEIMYAVETIAAGTVRVRSRGADGTLARAHDVLAPVKMGTAEDFSYPDGAEAPRPPYYDEIISYGENGAVALPNKNTTVLLTKATAGAYTLAAPTLAMDGIRVCFINQTAAAHVLTATTLFASGLTGSPHTTATFAAFKGSSLTVEATAGLWSVIAATATPLT